MSKVYRSVTVTSTKKQESVNDDLKVCSVYIGNIILKLQYRI